MIDGIGLSRLQNSLTRSAQVRLEGLLRLTIGQKQLASRRKNQWARRELGDLVNFKSGGTPNKATDEFWNGDIPWVSAKDLKIFDIAISQDKLTKEGAAEVNIVPKDTILLLVRGMGLFKDLPLGVSTRPLAFNQDIKALIPKAEVGARFIAYVLRANRKLIMDRVDRSGHGTGRLATDFLEAMPVAFPEVVEQNKIVRLLDVAEIQLRNLSRRADLLRVQKRALLQATLEETELTKEDGSLLIKTN